VRRENQWAFEWRSLQWQLMRITSKERKMLVLLVPGEQLLTVCG
jgi:hypothetical protein